MADPSSRSLPPNSRLPGGCFDVRPSRYIRCVTDRNELPIPDYDHLPEGALAHRIRSLPAEELGVLLDYEREHGNRLPVVQLLEQRLDAVASGEATPSRGDPRGMQPEHAPPPEGRPPVEPAAPQVNNQPLRHGMAEQTPNRDLRGK